MLDSIRPICRRSTRRRPRGYAKPHSATLGERWRPHCTPATLRSTGQPSHTPTQVSHTCFAPWSSIQYVWMLSCGINRVTCMFCDEKLRQRQSLSQPGFVAFLVAFLVCNIWLAVGTGCAKPWLLKVFFLCMISHATVHTYHHCMHFVETLSYMAGSW